MNQAELIERFEKDIIFDCHAVWIRVSRSRAGKEILALGPSVLPDLAVRLEGYKLPEGQEAHSDSLKWAWSLLLSWLVKEHGLEGRPKLQADFDGWVKWLQAQTQAPA